MSGTTPSGDGSGAILPGNVSMVVAVVAYGAYGVQDRYMRGGERYPAVVVTAASFAAGLLFLLLLAAGEAILFGAPELGPQGWVVVARWGAVATALAMFLWNHTLPCVPASATALYVNLVPAVGLGLALLFGERAGGALAVAGVLLRDAVLSKERGPRRPGSGVG